MVYFTCIRINETLFTCWQAEIIKPRDNVCKQREKIFLSNQNASFAEVPNVITR